MLTVNIKSLIQKLNPVCKTALEAAAGVCIQQGHYEITLQHWLLKLLEHSHSDLVLLTTGLEVDLERARQGLQRSLQALPAGNTSKPTFSPQLFQVMQAAWLLGSVDLGLTTIRSATVVLALIQESSVYFGSPELQPWLRLDKAEIVKRWATLFADSVEQSSVSEGTGAAGSEGGLADSSALKQFCEDLTAKARKGELDPVIGREDSIRQMIDILCRRRKNNPILVGEAGVGKTAVIEGLALKVVAGEVPNALLNVAILSLDMTLLEAGASVKGVFESRLKAVINEVKSSEKPIILFIDEAHSIIGAGGQEGHDAANILKPALARGELRTIAATTWREYKKYFEKDPALTRRFQLIKLDPPSSATTVDIIRGLKSRYEAAHGVVIRDDAVVAAVELSSRYLTGRQQPDKAVDLLDTCAARVQVSLSAKPAAIEQLEKQLAAAQQAEEALRRDQDHGLKVERERLQHIVQQQKDLQHALKQLQQRWQAEKQLMTELLAVRAQILMAEGKAKTALQKQRGRLGTQLQRLQAGEPLLYCEVDPDAVAKVVSDWTGVPLGKVLRDEAASLQLLPEQLRARIKGQDSAISLVAEHLTLAKAGLKAPNQPMGIFLLVGPSGVGKTETALTVADTLFGGEHSLVTVNMSEFQEKHTISRLIGSPPGYVGFGEGGMLTEAIRQRPYSVVLLDEVEKASLDVLNLFYQVFDKGTLTDGEGREVDFSNTVIFLTSNLATDEITTLCQADPAVSSDTILQTIRPLLSRWFKPALLARTTVVPYRTLGDAALTGIVELKMASLVKRLHTQHGLSLHYTPEVLAQVTARCTEVETGARNIDHILRSAVLPKISDVIIATLAGAQSARSLTLKVAASGEFECIVN